MTLGLEPEQQYFADGLAEDIITRLSRLPWLFVSARNSSFTFQSGSAGHQLVGRELGVRYVLSGSVRETGDRLRRHRPAEYRRDRSPVMGWPL